MKTLKFLLSAVVAVALIFCSCGEKGKNGGGDPPPDPVPTFSIQYINSDEVYQDITNGAEIVITDYSQEDSHAPRQFEFVGKIFGEDAMNMSVTLTRIMQEGDYEEFCSDVCYLGNGETTQTFTWDFTFAEQDFYAHCYMYGTGDDTIVYDFVDNAFPNVHVKVTVIYRSL